MVLRLCDEIATTQRGGSMRVRETLEKKWRTTGPSFGVRKRCEHLSLFSLMQLNMTHFIDRRTKLGLGEDYIFNF